MRFAGFDELLSYQATHFGENTAFLYEENSKKQRCTYQEFYSLVQKKVSCFRMQEKTCFGVLCNNSFESVLTILSANIAGKQVVLLDNSLNEEQLSALCQYTDVDAFFADEKLSVSLGSGVEEGKDKILFFTSGTTNFSKAVVLTGHSLCQSAYNGGDKLPLSEKDTLLCILPLAHVFGFVCGLLWGLSFGATIALGRGKRHYIDDLSFFKPTVISLVPSLLAFLFTHQLFNPELRLVLIGAGECDASLLKAVKQTGLRVSFGYGLTETSSGVAISTGDDPYAMDICIDDTITLAKDGEICIQAPTCVMLGYYKNAKATGKVLKNGVLFTGDLGKWDENHKLHVLGRKKEVLVLSDGTKLFLPEYEQKIAQALNLQDIAVCLCEGKPHLIYYGDYTEDEVRKQLKGLMQTYPYSQQIVGITRRSTPLPRSASGKVKRYQLQAGG